MVLFLSSVNNFTNIKKVNHKKIDDGVKFPKRYDTHMQKISILTDNSKKQRESDASSFFLQVARVNVVYTVLKH